MEEIDKRLFTLKRAIRMAINESELSLSIVENVLDAIKSEVIQQNCYRIMEDQLTKEAEGSDRYDQFVDDTAKAEP